MTLVDEVKTILQYTDGKHDAYLAVMVPILEDHVKEECNNPFTQGLPGAAKLYIAKACQHNMQARVSAKKLGSVSYSYDLDFPADVTKLLRPYRRVRYHAF